MARTPLGFLCGLVPLIGPGSHCMVRHVEVRTENKCVGLTEPHVRDDSKDFSKELILNSIMVRF